MKMFEKFVPNNKPLFLILPIQFFAEGGDPPPIDPPPIDPPTPPTPPTKVEFTPEQQAEFDRILGVKLAKERLKNEKELNDKIAAVKTEAEKLAQMNADQKAEYERQKREDDIAKRESDITRRELRAEALETLADKGLPKTLADILVFTDAATTKTSLESVETSFRTAVEEEVNKRLKGSAPGGGGSKTNTNVNPWDKATRNLTEQARISAENPQLAAQYKASAK